MTARPPSADRDTYVDRRQQRIVRTPAGMLLDEAAFLEWMKSWAADRPKRVIVRRLSEVEIVSPEGRAG